MRWGFWVVKLRSIGGMQVDLFPRELSLQKWGQSEACRLTYFQGGVASEKRDFLEGEFGVRCRLTHGLRFFLEGEDEASQRGAG